VRNHRAGRGNIGCVLPKPGFLETVRKLTERYNIVLIFDEVYDRVQVAYGGAQAHYGIQTRYDMPRKGNWPAVCRLADYGGKKKSCLWFLLKALLCRPAPYREIRGNDSRD